MDQKPVYLRGGRGRGAIKIPEELVDNTMGPTQLFNGADHRGSGLCRNSVNSFEIVTNNKYIPSNSRNGKVTNGRNMSTNNSNITTFDTASVRCKQIIKNNENNSGTQSENIPKHVDMIKQHRHSGEEIFRAAAASHQDAAKRQLPSTSDAFLLSDEDEEEDFDLKKDAVMSNLLQKLNNKASLDTVVADDLGRTVKYIEEALRSKSNVCLICIESVLQTDPVWNCSGCFTMFHIQCMQQWIREGVQHKSALSSEHFPNKDRLWFCPKCRHEYQQKDFPKLYVCFCGKETDPAFDAWLVPHSCGHSCGRALKPDCGHRCLLQCHPGPCPPCAKTVRSSCFCGRSSEQVRRCGVARWSCGMRCGRTMNCGHHSCPRPCHVGDCGDCPQTSQQSCMCQKNVAVVQCATPHWKCDQACNKQLSCNNHKCWILCHSGSCPPCPKDGKRKCPCGKTKFELPCTEEAPTCLETCDMPLECGLHRCTSRCHQGPCGMCREMTKKRCRCGRREKELQCFKEFQCEIKCTTLKDCGVHQCKRKCCDGSCPPCTATCGKPLKCRQHKCANTCHLGPCYPCTRVALLKCYCLKTVKSVPCGSEKRTKPPKCSRPCTNPLDCHHPARIPHSCHFGECSRCSQTCSKQLIGCSHSCPAPCHTAVKVEVKDNQPRTLPWEVREPKKFKVVCQPCPPCLVPVSVTCFGGHETSKVDCSNSELTSCQRPCGRSLPCLNHTCQMPCHVVEGVESGDLSKAGTNCKACEEPCTKPRPLGCIHCCLLPCHPGQCPPCSQMIKMRCHCQMVVKHVPCDEWCSSGGGGNGKEAETLRSCGCRCPKLLSCSHRCQATCHSGDCPPAPDCPEKVKVRCPCGRKKEELLCHVIQSGKGLVNCNKSCEVEMEKSRKTKEAREKAALELEAHKRREELEEFDKRSKVNKRKRQRKQDTEEDDQGRSMLARNQMVILASVLMIVFALFAYKLLLQV